MPEMRTRALCCGSPCETGARHESAGVEYTSSIKTGCVCVMPSVKLHCV